MNQVRISVYISGTNIRNKTICMSGTNHSQAIQKTSRRIFITKLARNLKLEYLALNPNIKSLVRITFERIAFHIKQNGIKNLLNHIIAYKLEFYVEPEMLEYPLSFRIFNDERKPWVSRIAVLNGVTPYALNHSQEYDFLRFQNRFSVFIWDLQIDDKSKISSIFDRAISVKCDIPSNRKALLFQNLQGCSIYYARTIISRDKVIPIDAYNYIDSSWPSDFIFQRNTESFLFRYNQAPRVFPGKYVYLGSSTSWFHFLVEVFPRYLHLDGGRLGERIPIVEEGTPSQILQVLKLVTPKDPLQLSTIGVAEFDDLLVCTEHRFPSGLDLPSRASDLALVRDFFDLKFNTGSYPKEAKVFIVRNKKLFRRTDFMDSLSDFCSKLGFAVVDTGELNLKQQIDLFASAKVVIGETGSSLTNLIFCSPGTKVLEINTLNFMSGFFREFTDALSLSHVEITDVTRDGEEFLIKLNGLQVNLRDLLNGY